MRDELDSPSTRTLQTGLIILTIGALLFWAATTVSFVLVDADFWSGTTAERAARIDEHMAAWRTTWAAAMPGEVLVGIGMFIVGLVLARSRTGATGAASLFVAAAGLAHIPIGVARFATSLSDGTYAADPGLWFDVLYGVHFIGLVLASLLLAWLGWGRLVPRWVSVIMVLFTLLGLVIAGGAATIYFPPIVAFGAATLWRLRATSPSIESTPALT